MQRIIIRCIALLALSFNIFVINEANGQSVSPGFYRVQCSSAQLDLDSVSSKRYISVIHNEGFSINDIIDQYFSGNNNPDLDLHAVRMVTAGYEVSDPSTVIYIEPHNNTDTYNLRASGYGTHDITGEYLYLTKKTQGTDANTTTYNAYAYRNLIIKKVYIYVEDSEGFDKAAAGDVATTQWYIKPIDTGNGGDTFFGVSPKYRIGDFYYTTLRTAFSYNLSNNNNVHAYQMSSDGEILQLSQPIAANTPVILQCSSTNPSENRLYPLSMGGKNTDQASSCAGFYTGNEYSYFKTAVVNSHVNQTSSSYPRGQSAGFGTADPSSGKRIMRVLSVKDGKLGFFDSFADTYPDDLCLNGELAYCLINTDNNDANGGMTIVENPTVTSVKSTDGTLKFNATFAAANDYIKLQYSLNGVDWIETDGNISIASRDDVENGVFYVRTYNGGIFSDIVEKYIDPLTVAYVDETNKTIYAKDDNGAEEQSVGDGEIDFMDSYYKENSHADNSNWVAIQVSKLPSELIETDDIDVSGKVVEVLNRTINGNVVKLNTNSAFTPNTYCIANFAGAQQVALGKTFFFAQPQPNEICEIVWAMWDEASQSFIVPPKVDGYVHNSFGLTGSVKANLKFINETPVNGHVYQFKALVRKESTASAAPRMATGTNEYVLYPLDELTDVGKLDNGVYTSITGVNTSNVVSVKYYNAMGLASDVPFRGVNIVVTTYGNGTHTTTKLIK